MPEDSRPGKRASGRPSLIGTDESADKIDRTFKKYRQSDKGKEAVERYRTSEKGKETREKYTSTEKGKLTLKKYYESPKGQKAHAKRRQKVQGFRDAQRWLEENPGKTFEDYEQYRAECGAEEIRDESREEEGRPQDGTGKGAKRVLKKRVQVSKPSTKAHAKSTGGTVLGKEDKQAGGNNLPSLD